MYKKIADIITPEKKGEAKLDVFEIPDPVPFSAAISGLSSGKYARLFVNGVMMMSETPMEERTNRNFVSNAHGDVLIGGLGIGMIILAIQDNENVKSITVLEKSKDVVDIITKQLPFNDKVKVIIADVFDYKPTMKYDCIYMDIWPIVNNEIYAEMVKLKKKYGHYLKPLAESPKRYNRCWCEYQAKNNRRLY